MCVYIGMYVVQKQNSIGEIFDALIISTLGLVGTCHIGTLNRARGFRLIIALTDTSRKVDAKFRSIDSTSFTSSDTACVVKLPTVLSSLVGQCTTTNSLVLFLRRLMKVLMMKKMDMFSIQ